jgi:hypothetical protein
MPSLSKVYLDSLTVEQLGDFFALLSVDKQKQDDFIIRSMYADHEVESVKCDFCREEELDKQFGGKRRMLRQLSFVEQVGCRLCLYPIILS